jgi:hypothetical protein
MRPGNPDYGGVDMRQPVYLCSTEPGANARSCRRERDRDRVSAPVENGSRHLRFAGYDPALREEDDHVPRPRHRGILLSRLASAAGGSL